jgi:hypothetical protein
VVGVVAEVVFVIWEYLEDLRDFKRGIVRPPDKPSWLLFALGFFGAALVSLGVGGELYAESKIATLETCIRKGNDALSLLLSKEAGDAMASAQGAAASAASARADEKQLAVTLANSISETKLAEKVLADAQKENAKLQLDMSILLGGKIWAREPNPKDFESLKRFPGTKATVLYKAGDGEAYEYAASILLQLRAVGWDVPNHCVPITEYPALGTEGPIVGMSFSKYMVGTGAEVFRQEQLPVSERSRLAVLARALKAHAIWDPHMPENEFIIIVGERRRSPMPWE